MKKVTTVFYFLVVAVVAANAQYFAEWSMGMNYDDFKVPEFGNYTTLTSNKFFVVSPSVGYRLNENFAMGVKVSLTGTTRSNIDLDDPNNPDSRIEVESKMRGWVFSVFDRYKLWGTKKLSLFVESSIFISGNSTKDKRGSIINYDQYRSAVGIKALPLVTYDLSDKFSIISTCDFFSLTFMYETDKRKLDNVKFKKTYFLFDSLSDIFTSLGSIKLGIIYNF